MNAINRISICFFFLILSSIVSAASRPDISGTYECKGSDPFTQPPPFSESLVFEKSGDTYKLKAIPTGDTFPYFLGTIVFNKDVDNAFSSVYWNVKDPRGFGTELFTINKDGSLDAVFVGYSRDKSGTETCTKVS